MFYSILRKQSNWTTYFVIAFVTTMLSINFQSYAASNINTEVKELKPVKDLQPVDVFVPVKPDLQLVDEIKLPNLDTVEVPLLAPGVIDVAKISETDFLRIQPPVHEPIEPSFKFQEASHVTNGVALRNRTSGTIHLRGVPLRRKVIAALLYWNFLDDKEIGREEFPVLFNGNKVIGRKTADSPDPCWADVIGSHSYVANVTRYVDGSGHPNQDYEVVLFFNDKTSTTGQNPWSPTEIQKVRTEGANLIVVYHEPESGPLYIYDNLNNSMFSGNASFNLLHPFDNRPALFSMFGIDGQRGFGHDNSITNEKTFFNVPQIAGCPVTNSDWDGSDGWPMPQLSDTHTHHVVLSNDTANVRYQANGDCLVPVAFVIDVN